VLLMRSAPSIFKVVPAPVCCGHVPVSNDPARSMAFV